MNLLVDPLIFFAEEAKRRGYTIKVVGTYSFKKSRRYDSPQLRFTKTLPEGITVTEFHPRTKKSKEINVRFNEPHNRSQPGTMTKRAPRKETIEFLLKHNTEFTL